MVIQVNKDYYIDVDTNGNHEARLDLHKVSIQKMKDGTEVERPMYKTIGHYSNVKNACSGIYRHMCVEKGNKKDKISLSEWIDIQKETLDEINKCMERLEV